MLFSSKDEEKTSLEEIDSGGIPAHKAILSTSSQVSCGVVKRMGNMLHVIRFVGIDLWIGNFVWSGRRNGQGLFSIDYGCFLFMDVMEKRG